MRLNTARQWATRLLALLLAFHSTVAPMTVSGPFAPRIAVADEQAVQTEYGDEGRELVPPAPDDAAGTAPETPALQQDPGTDVAADSPDADFVPEETAPADLGPGAEEAAGPKVTGTYLLDPNGVEADTQERPIFDGTESFVAPECPFTWDRHAFRGWNTSAAGDGVSYTVGEDIPVGGASVLYAQWDKTMPEGVQDLDFTSCRLIAATDEPPVAGEVLSEHDGVYLLRFEDKADTAWAYVDLLPVAHMVAPDQTFEAASLTDTLRGEGVQPTLQETLAGKGSAELPQFVPHGDGDVSGPPADLSAIDEAQPVEPGVVALVDTGVNVSDEYVVSRTSVIGDVVVDDNGHGTSMLKAMRDVDPSVRVASIKALDSWGTGSAASVYAAVQSAIHMGAKVVNLSLSAPAIAGNAAVEQAIRDAYDAGVIVVGAAGNDDKDARWYVPGRMGDEAVIAGSCDTRGERHANSNFGATVDVWIPSESTSYAAAKASAWLAGRAAFGEELATLTSPEAQEALGVRINVAGGTDDGAPAGDGQVQAAFTHPSIKVQAYWHGSTRSFWGATYTSSIQGPANTGQEGRNYDLYAIKFTLNSGSESGGMRYRGYYNGTWNAYKTTGEVGSLSAKLVKAEFAFTGDLGMHYVWGHAWHKYIDDGSTGGDAENCQPVICDSGGVAIDGIGVWFKKQSWPQTIMVRYQNADGTYGSYTKAKSDVKEYQDTYGWSRDADATYEAASVSYTVTKEETKYVTVNRRSSNNVIQARYQNEDGSWGPYADVVNQAFAIGQTVSWTSPATDTFQAASCSFAAGSTGRTERVSVYRKTAVARVRYRLQNVDGSYPDTYTEGGSATKCVGGSYTYTYRQTDTHKETSGTATIVAAPSPADNPADVTVDLDVPRLTCAVRVDVYDPWGHQTNEPGAVHAAYFDLSVDGGATWLCDLYDEPSPVPTPCRGQTVVLRNLQARPGFQIKDVSGVAKRDDGTYAASANGDITVSITTKCLPFSVTFDPNGGTAPGSLVKSASFGESVAAPQVTRVGHTFIGWVPLNADDPKWVEVLYQSPMGAGFGNEAGALSANELDAYSRLGQLDRLGSGGGWEFALSADELDGTNRWRQTSNPATADNVDGFSAGSLSWDAATFKGLARSGSGSLASWSGASGGWWYAMGMYERGKLPLVQERSLRTWQPVHLYVLSDATLSTVDAAYDSGYGAGCSIPVRAENQLFKALWHAHTLTVSYDANGGAFARTPPDDVYTWNDGEVSLPSFSDAVRDGYEPKPQWHVGSPDGPLVAADTPITPQDLAKKAGVDLADGDQAITLYLDWRLMRYTVVFDPNCDPADVTGQTPSLEGWRGREVVMPACGFARELHDFVSWNTKPDGSGDWYGPGASAMDLPAEGVAEMRMFAIWRPKQVKVIIPTAIHYVAHQTGVLSGPDDDVAQVTNASPEVNVEICGIRAESYEPWHLVREGSVTVADDYALGMSLGTGVRHDFFTFDGTDGRFGCLAPAQQVALNGLRGEVGQAPAEEQEVGCLHWRIRAIRAKDLYA